MEQITKKRKLSYSFCKNDNQLDNKKSKTDEISLINLLNNNHINEIQSACVYLKNMFPKDYYKELPQIILLNQLYSIIKNKTNVDKYMEVSKNENKIIFFSFDGSDIFICEKIEFNQFIKKISQKEKYLFNSINISRDRFEFLIDLFLDKILNEVYTLRISSVILKNKYNMSEIDITCLVQFGLLIIKDGTDFWLSMPGIGKFRKDLLNARSCLKKMVQKKKVFIKKFFKYILFYKLVF